MNYIPDFDLIKKTIKGFLLQGRSRFWGSKLDMQMWGPFENTLYYTKLVYKIYSKNTKLEV